MSTAQVCPDKTTIDLEHDELRPVGEICERKTGRRPSPQCVWRWRIKGCRGVKLECVLLQGVWQTTEAAFAAFIRGQTQAAVDACTAADQEPVERDAAKTRRLKAAGLI